jgi:RimJ/RimL family protein N-acetyltransferase
VAEKTNPILLDIPQELTGERLVLRVPRAGDSVMVWPSVRDSLKELKIWMPWATDDYNEQGAEEWCRRASGEFILRMQIPYLILLHEGGAHVGTLSAGSLEWNIPRCEIGYWLHSAHTGHGYMAEAVGVLMVMLRDTLKMRRVQLRADANNAKSRRVAERAGFQLEGILRTHSDAKEGKSGDTCVFAWTS